MSATDILKTLPSYVSDWREAVEAAEAEGEWVLDSIAGIWDCGQMSAEELLTIRQTLIDNEDPEVPETFILVSLRS
jgi:hypothetical protein